MWQQIQRAYLETILVNAWHWLIFRLLYINYSFRLNQKNDENTERNKFYFFLNSENVPFFRSDSKWAMIGKKLKTPSTINSEGTGLIFPYLFRSFEVDLIVYVFGHVNWKARLLKNFISRDRA